VSFELSHLTVKSLSPVDEGDFVKTHLLLASQKLCCTNWV